MWGGYELPCREGEAMPSGRTFSKISRNIFMAPKMMHNPILSETTCGSLLHDLQLIWDEVGESDSERDKMLLQLEQECLDVYRRKVDQANLSRARLHQLLADSEAELAHLLSALGERSFVGRPEKQTGTLKEQLAAIAPALGDLRQKKEERVKKFMDVQVQIQSICGEIAGNLKLNDSSATPKLDENDLSLKKLDEFHLQLQELHREKIQELGTTLIELWNLMDAPLEEQKHFDHVTSYISASVDEVSGPRALALEIIEQAEVEVKRLDQLKASKMKELVFKKQTELEEIYRRAHMEVDASSTQEKIMNMIDSGTIDHSELLASMDDQIAKAKEEALSRKEIMEKVEKWMTACEEESWLEDYNRDENRYSVSRGAHISLKRAERARVMVNKIPALVDSLMAKTRAWEEERQTTFLYDEVPLLAMLDEYNMLRQEREEEKRRLRDRKRLQGQLATEQEIFFGSRPSPIRPFTLKRNGGVRANGTSMPGTPSNRRLSLGINQSGMNGVAPGRQIMSVSKDGKRENSRLIIPLHYVPFAKEDSASQVSAYDSTPSSP
eukprot:Gb_27482 [translate_table: standard]